MNVTTNDPVSDVATKEENNKAPDQQTQEKIIFIFNTIGLSNLDQKSNELKSILDAELSKDIIISWLAKYLVGQLQTQSNLFHVW